MSAHRNDSKSLAHESSPSRKLMAGRGEFRTAARGATGMDCPRCGSGLAPGKHETGIAWRCFQCGGESLNFSQFRRMIPEEQVDRIWWTAKGKPVASPQGTACPECRRPMLAVLIPFREEELELDICQGCQRLWRDGPRAARVSPRLNIGCGATANPPVLEMRPRPARPRRRGEGRRTVRSAARSRSSLIPLLACWGRSLLQACRRKWRW